MVKHLSTLALRALRVNQEVSAHLTRIHSGFLPDRNITQAQQVLNELQTMLQDMEKALKAPLSQTSSSSALPLK